MIFPNHFEIRARLAGKTLESLKTIVRSVTAMVVITIVLYVPAVIIRILTISKLARLCS